MPFLLLTILVVVVAEPGDDESDPSAATASSMSTPSERAVADLVASGRFKDASEWQMATAASETCLYLVTIYPESPWVVHGGAVYSSLPENAVRTGQVNAGLEINRYRTKVSYEAAVNNLCPQFAGAFKGW